jgi:hypothetical protein
MVRAARNQQRHSFPNKVSGGTGSLPRPSPYVCERPGDARRSHGRHAPWSRRHWMTVRHSAHLSPNYVADTVRAALPALGVVEGSNIVALGRR